MSYSPTLGRFLQRDPAEYVDGANVYQYARSNPTNLTDPSGLGPFGPGAGRVTFHPPLPKGAWATGDFWHHYLGEYEHAGLGRGRPVDLGDIGLLGTFQNAEDVLAKTNEFSMKIQARAAAVAKSLGCDNPSASFMMSDDVGTNVVREIFVVARSILNRVAYVTVSVGDCVCCDGKRYPTSFTYTASVGFSINDEFRDPFEGDRIGLGALEHPSGTPYSITASWSTTVSGSGKLPAPC